MRTNNFLTGGIPQRIGLILAMMSVASGMNRVLAASPPSDLAKRQVIRLDGTWQIEQGGIDIQPKDYGHAVPVPGLVDMAEPQFAEVGRKSTLREAFWYRRTFTVAGEIPPVAILKLQKLKYGSRIFLNGTPVGAHRPNFTPAYLDVQAMLRGHGHENELVICVGADRENPLASNLGGWDFEKYRYIPGIYDSVELILTGGPYVENVQVAPQLEDSSIRVQTRLVNPLSQPLEGPVEFVVREDGSGVVAARFTCPELVVPAKGSRTQEVEISISGARWWRPESPFLYRLEVVTAGDKYDDRFGMRSFRFDPTTKRAILNGRPFYLRGSNVTLYRFFEDADRGGLPWNREWVRALHRRFKQFHWNSLRYCIGFPPEFWYDIADEEGILIQDEYPLWTLSPESMVNEFGLPREVAFPRAEDLIPEYTAWMRERWNHPCVVIWDAQNESHTAETGKALRAVRHLDLSHRPWDNGWGAPQSATDMVESHPYLFSKGWNGGDQFFDIRTLASHDGVPYLQPAQKSRDTAIVINEYGWLWLDRKGYPTSIDRRIYDALLPNATVDERREFWARNLAALTEFWRAHRRAAGVLEFCALGYSRRGDLPRPEGGATSDHFLDVAELEFQREFLEYVPDAFAPVGLMVDLWGAEFPVSKSFEVPIVVVNDLHREVEGVLTIRLFRDREVLDETKVPFQIEALGKARRSLALEAPKQTSSHCEVIAELRHDQSRVRSRRLVQFSPAAND